jgi:hypothetical protein
MAKASLDEFELNVAARSGEEAWHNAYLILRVIDERFGRLDGFEALGFDADESFERRIERFATRYCAALGQLVTDRSAPFPPARFEQLLAYHRWVDLLFSNSGFRSSGHLMPLLGQGPRGAWRIEGEDLLRFFLVYMPASGLNIDFAQCMQANAPAAVSAFLNYLGTRYCFTPTGHAFRERLLEWLPGKLDTVKLGQFALQRIAETYMHCSYAETPRKHDIKADIIVQMRRALLEAGCPEYDPASPPPKAKKPVIVVTTEHFGFGHSVHRTHSRAIRALKDSFHVVGLCYPQHVSPQIEEVFDELLTYQGGEFLPSVRVIAETILERRPVMVFHLGVGMSPYVIALASLRLAPLQACSFGHTATTRSPVIDEMILPEDFIGSPDCWSEHLALVPPRAMPYEPRRDMDIEAIVKSAGADRSQGVVRVAVAASIMKLNPPFFAALAEAVRTAKTPIEFNFFPLAGVGLAHAELKQRLAGQLPSAVVHAEQPYPDYMARLAACDFFVCPFPYGNMNSIIDALLLGLPGVCLDGAEAHAHADVAYFARAGLPPELGAKSREDYVAAIVKLADDEKWRARCQAAARKADLEDAFFTGEEHLFREAVEKLVAQYTRRPALAPTK